MSTDPQNSVSGASGTGPAQGYRLETLLIHVLVLLFHMMNMFHASQVSSTINHIITMLFVMNYAVIMWIKLIQKMPNYSTIQKSYCRPFSITGFVAALKPTIFYSAN